jgi:DNA-binding XRE family transcriptional regulator
MLDYISLKNIADAALLYNGGGKNFYLQRRSKMEFKDKIIRIRAKLDLTQGQLAKELDVSLITLNRWENGHRMPCKKKVMQIKDWCVARSVPFDEV